MDQGRYHWEHEIARDGSGPVWLGWDRSLERQVALKRVGEPQGGAGPDLERAQREARLVARLGHHPHLVAVYDLVSEDDGNWLVMEYVPGTTLARRVDVRGPLGTEEASRVLRGVADALAVAHRADIVHRDVKPQNVLLGQGSNEGVVKLSDFGVARGQGDPSMTRPGYVTGSPAYLAPEVAAGDEATQASDVWSLGATLYQALTGHAPYAMEGNVLGGLYRIVHSAPPRLPDHGRVGWLLEVTMVHDPAQRWSAARVRDFLDGRPEAEPRPEPTRRLPVAGPPVGPPPEPPVEEEFRTGASGPGPTNTTGFITALIAFLALLLVGVLWLQGAFSGIGEPDSPAETPGETSTPSPSDEETPSEEPTPSDEATPSEEPSPSDEATPSGPTDQATSGSATAG